MDDAKLCDEEGRLAALRRYAVLDSEPEPAFEKITALVKAVLGTPMCAVSLVDRNRQWFKSRQGISEPETPRTVAFCDHTIRTRETMVVNDATVDPRFAESSLVTGPPFVRSYAGVPLATPDGYNLGALCVKDTKPRQFTPDEIRILEHFAGLVVAEMELRTIADRDALTGALSRRAFVEELGKEQKRFDRYRRPSVLVMFDLDHFKQINDTYGHPGGDEVLVKAIDICSLHLRPSDQLGRLGGEEFAILLPETSVEEALQCAERLRIIFEISKVGCNDIRFTASFGVAPAGGEAASVEQWLAEADAALYMAKGRGRNLCVASSSLLAAAA